MASWKFDFGLPPRTSKSFLENGRPRGANGLNRILLLLRPLDRKSDLRSIINVELRFVTRSADGDIEALTADRLFVLRVQMHEYSVSSLSLCRVNRRRVRMLPVLLKVKV